MASHPILDDYGDAVKSAQSDAMKKALAHFSIGKRAYQGLLADNKKLSRKDYQNNNKVAKENGEEPF